MSLRSKVGFIDSIKRRSTSFKRFSWVHGESQVSQTSLSSTSTPHSPELAPNSQAVEPSPPSSLATSPSPSESALTTETDVAAAAEITKDNEIVSDPIASTTNITIHSTSQPSKTQVVPLIDNYKPGQIVTDQIVLLEGHIPKLQRENGVINIRYNRNQLPTTSWPVSDSKFKALVYLNSGSNHFNLEIIIPGTSKRIYSTDWHLIYHPMTSCPPIKLVLVHASNSKYAKTHLNPSVTTPLSIAMAKFRMAAYLWQIFMSEATNNQAIRRSFQLENEWSESTLYSGDAHTHEMRNEAPVHVVPLENTLEELRGMNHDEFLKSVERTLVSQFRVSDRKPAYFACVFMDSDGRDEHVYGGPGLISGTSIHLAVTGDNLLSSYPSSIDSVTAAFCSEVPTESTSETVRWKCASVGIARHLKQVLTMLGIKNNGAGIMADELVNFAAMFSLYSAKVNAQPQLHPLDVIRLRYHPLFRSPLGPFERVRPNTAPIFWGISDQHLLICSSAGLIAIEIYNPGEEICKNWINLLEIRGMPRYKHTLTSAEINQHVLSDRQRSRMSFRPGSHNVKILTADGNSTYIEDLNSFIRDLSLTDSKTKYYRSNLMGTNGDRSVLEQQIFPPNSRMINVIVYHNPGVCVTGIEFVFEPSSHVLFGSKNSEASKVWPIRSFEGEYLFGMEICVQETVLGLRLITNQSRTSPWFGCAGVGTQYKLIPPETFRLAGIEGNVGNEIRSLRFIIKR